MKKILFLTTTPTKGGNGDTLIEASMSAAKANGAEVIRIDVRDKQIQFCKACYSCSTNGICVQKDDFGDILSAMHDCDGIVAEAPIYYNCMAAQAMTVVNRLCPTFACKIYQLGPKKKIGMMLTCVGSSSEDMKRHIDLILTLPSIQRSINEYRTEVFTDCTTPMTCRNTNEYLDRAKEIGKWVTEEV